MKATLFLLLVFVSENLFASSNSANLFDDQDLSCIVTSEDKRYDDIFFLEVRKEGLSKIKYKRKHLASPVGEYGELEIVRGCYHARQVENKDRPHVLSIECQSDGEEGMAFIDTNTMTGWLHFYQPKIGYGERTGLELQCERI